MSQYDLFANAPWWSQEQRDALGHPPRVRLQSCGGVYDAWVWRSRQSHEPEGCILRWHDGTGYCQAFVPATGDEYRRVLELYEVESGTSDTVS